MGVTVTDRRNTAGENDRPVREQDKVMLRLPDGMRDRLKDAAGKNNRSMNAEIVARLEDSFDQRARLVWRYGLMLADALQRLLVAHGQRAADFAAVLDKIVEVATPDEEALRLFVSVESEIDRLLEEALELLAQAPSKEQTQEAFERLYEETQRLLLLTDRRIPEGLYARISKVAQKNARPVDEEVVQALEKAFPPPRPAHELRQIADMLEEFIDRPEHVRSSADEQFLSLAAQLRKDADEQEAEK